jgi:hypothetical protein
MAADPKAVALLGGHRRDDADEAGEHESAVVLTRRACSPRTATVRAAEALALALAPGGLSPTQPPPAPPQAARLLALALFMATLGAGERVMLKVSADALRGYRCVTRC